MTGIVENRIVESYWVRFSVKVNAWGISKPHNMLVRSPIKIGNQGQYDKLVRVIHSRFRESSILDIKQLSWLGTFFQEKGEVLDDIWYE